MEKGKTEWRRGKQNGEGENEMGKVKMEWRRSKCLRRVIDEDTHWYSLERI